MDTANTPTPAAAAAAPTEHSANAPPSYDSAQLLGADGIAFITHQGQRYQLRQTKAGKLILTK
ncbi:hemin uptake protein HemP [uncultured Serratia sp.]|uniref:hemin uptake protein HemP n=1 Tax=Serratia marcescens TaxID=615 RepID=UPI002590FD56|nr:hemin uptake protein HemP [uncultured Serratia sp.]